MKSLVHFLNISPASYRCFSPATIQILNDRIIKFDLERISLFKVDNISSYVLGLDTIEISDSKYIMTYLKETDNSELINRKH